MINGLSFLQLDIRSLGGFTDDEFYHFCLDNPDLKFERDWNRKNMTGICFDSSTDFNLPNGAVRSPDAAWVKTERWNALSEKQKERFPPVCPDFVIEIKSPSDSLSSLKNKMEEWISNGCRLAWLISPEERLTYVYSNGKTETVSFNESLSGKEVAKGFEINLSRVFS